MEAICYMLIYLFKGHLPWMNIKTDRNKNSKICLTKMNIEIQSLCDQMPEEFANFLSNIRSLTFEQEPDYVGLNQMFVNLLKKKYGLSMNDRVYDWTRSHVIKTQSLRNF